MSKLVLSGLLTTLTYFAIPMRAEFIAYMIYSEGPEYPEYVMLFLPKVFWDPQKYRNMLGKFSPSLCFSANRKLPKVFGVPRIQEYVMDFVLRSGPPVTGLRKPKSEKVLQRVLGRVLGKGGVPRTVLGGRFYWKHRGTALFQQSP